MATSKINCTDYYKEGEEVNLCGTWIALSGQAQPYNAGFTIPGKKRFPTGATITLSNDFHLNWLRGENSSLTPVLKDAYVSGDSVLVEVKATSMAPLTFYCVHISAGTAIIHLQ